MKFFLPILFLISFLATQKVPVNQDYINEIESLQKSQENFNVEKFYEGWLFEDQSKPEDDKDRTVLFAKLSDVEKFVFYVHQGEVLNNRLVVFQSLLSKANVAETPVVQDPPIDNPFETKKEEPVETLLPTAEQIKTYLVKVKEIQIKHAKNFELFLIQGIKKYKKDLPESEMKVYLKKIQNWNDEHKLIDRSKGKK